MQALSEKLELLEARCRERGIPLTVQRRAVLEALVGRADHPTADQIYEVVQLRLQGVSRTTVYRVLETLVSLGLASKAVHYGTAARFDPNIEHHHHLVCMHCDKVIDIVSPELEDLEVPQVRRSSFEIVDFSVHFLGICRECKVRQKREKGVRKPGEANGG